jgi:hypothetical protein
MSTAAARHRQGACVEQEVASRGPRRGGLGRDGRVRPYGRSYQDPLGAIRAAAGPCAYGPRRAVRTVLLALAMCLAVGTLVVSLVIAQPAVMRGPGHPGQLGGGDPCGGLYGKIPECPVAPAP